jgi:type IV secretory pathway TraG/TraD family ATPase VirD4
VAGSRLSYLRDYLAAAGGRLYAGSVTGGLALADPEQSLLVIGPPRAGKTTAVAVPNVLSAPGPVVVTSTKPDILGATLQARSCLGRCWLFDPTGASGYPEGVTRLRWSPVASSSTWDTSLILARAMTAAARPFAKRGDSAHWTERAEALIAPLLLAANLRGEGIEEVLRWVLRQDTRPASTTLTAGGIGLGADVLAGIDATDPREQSGIWSSAAGVLAAYRSDAVLDNSSPVNMAPESLVATSDTVYICAPARHQDLVAPLVVAFLEQVRSGTYAARRRGTTGPPLTLVLDELANIAPIPDLPALVAEGGGQGLLTLACLQDLSQARQRWGEAADGFLSLFGAKLVLPGIGDLATLELVSRLCGEVEIPVPSTSRSPWWSPGGGAETVTWSTRRQRRVPVESVSQQPARSAILIAGSSPPETVRLPPWWEVAALDPGPPGPLIREQPRYAARDRGRDLPPGSGGRTIFR